MPHSGLPLRGDVLRRLRGATKQDVVAAGVGVALKTYSNWENAGREVGGNANPEGIARLAAYFKTTPEALIVPGYEPPVPIPTVEERLARIEAQLAALRTQVEDVAAGVQALLGAFEGPR